MRIYPAESIESLQTLKLLKHWAKEDLLTPQQHALLEEETVSDLRTTNLFLRLVLFFFTFVIVAAAVGLAFIALFEHSNAKDLVIPFLLLAGACYTAAEYAVHEARLFQFGIEEALVLCSIGAFFAGLQLAHEHFRAGSDAAEFFLLLACIVFSLWTWHRFGYWYTFVAAMLFAAFLPHCCTSSPAAQHTLAAVFFAAGLIGITAAGSRHRSDFLRNTYSLAEVFLWIGIYFAINLVLSVIDLDLPGWLTDFTPVQSDFPRSFYWFTWILIWCLPAIVLVRGIRRKDRPVLVLGAGLAILTFVSNKPYLGWHRHPWDPMLLGILLLGVAWYLGRWLARGPDGVRAGFTAARLAGKDNSWTNAGTSALGFFTPHPVQVGSGKAAPPMGEGGASGGGGASRDF